MVGVGIWSEPCIDTSFQPAKHRVMSRYYHAIYRTEVIYKEENYVWCLASRTGHQKKKHRQHGDRLHFSGLPLKAANVLFQILSPSVTEDHVSPRSSSGQDGRVAWLQASASTGGDAIAPIPS